MCADSEADRRFWSLSSSPALVFRVVLAGIMVSTSVGVWYALAHRPTFQVAFPGSTNPRVYAGLLSVAGIGLVALVGLWCWQRWAVALYGILAVLSVVLDMIARAPVVHQITIMSGAVAVFTLVYLNRRRFRAAGEAGGV